MSETLTNPIQDFIISPLGQLYQCSLVESEELPADDDLLMIKSLIWICDEIPYLIIIQRNLQVDRIKLASYLNISDIRRCRLSSMTQAEKLAGCHIGTIPAIPLKSSMKVIIDENLVNESISRGLEYICSGSSISGKALMIHLASYIQHGIGITTAAISTCDKINNAITSIQSASYVALVKPIPSILKPDKDHVKQSKNKAILFPYSTLRRLAATNVTDKFIQILQLYDSLCKNDGPKLNIDDPTGSGKTALQLAAWKGPIEHVTMLIERGANVNQYSTNIGNYGKTAIFYAITRCRDEFVLALLAHGAWVKIVNNKGQTPRSLAVSHLQPATLLAIEQAEESQAEISWLNFRQSHSDGSLYGDLDPRFLEDATWKYVLTQTQHYDDNVAMKNFDVISSDRKPRIIASTKSIFPTTFELRYSNLRRTPLDENEDVMCAEVAYGDVLLKPASTISSVESVYDDVDLPTLSALARFELLDRYYNRPPIPTHHNTISSSHHNTNHTIIDNSSVTLYGTILSKRHVGKLLVFANIIPYDNDMTSIFNYSTVQASKLTKLSWHIHDQESEVMYTTSPIAVQLVIGKTMYSRYGEAITRSVCKCVAPGQTVQVIGRYSAVDEDEDSLYNRLRHGNTTLDFLVHEYKILDANTSLSMPNIKSKGKSKMLKIVSNATVDGMVDNSMLEEDVMMIESDAGNSSSAVIAETPAIPKVNHKLNILSEYNCEDLVTRLASTAVTSSEITTLPSDVVDEPIDVHVHLIDDLESIHHLDEKISHIIHEHDHNIQDAHNIFVGIDCEWRPQRKPSDDYPVALLQIAIQDKVFLIDMLSLLSPSSIRIYRPHKHHRAVDHHSDSDNEDGAVISCIVEDKTVALDKALIRLFHHPKTIIVGFSLNSDLRKLHHSYPHITCFHHFPACMGLDTIMLKLNDSLFASHKIGRSLSKLSYEMLGRHLEKTEQCSPWHRRPLTRSQMMYASLDAIILLKINQQLWKRYGINDNSSSVINRYKMLVPYFNA